MIVTLQGLTGKIAAFMPQTGHDVAYTAVHVTGLSGILMDELGKVEVMLITRNHIQPVIGVRAGGHIYISAPANGNNALSADGVLIERMFRPKSTYRECPGIG